MTKKQIEGSPYSEKIWLKSYVNHVKPEIDVKVISLAEMMKKTVEEFPDSGVMIFKGIVLHTKK